jgi:peroxiredoxin (alkyl hydroperoxide reductase subunit C)
VNRVILPAVIAFGVVAIIGIVMSRKAMAHLESGKVAPDFTLQAARGGEVETFDLKTALAKGPVVLYFYPKSFTSGCTVEAHQFSEAVPEYEKLGATVIGVSSDDIDTQKRFSTEECRSAFLIASDPGLKVAKEYDAQLAGSFANRTSYVIAKDGTIAYAYTSLDPSKHVANTLEAVRALQPK